LRAVAEHEIIYPGPEAAIMDEDRIAIVDLADELQVRKQRLFKVLKRLGITATQRRDSGRRGQNVAVINATDAAAIRTELGRLAPVGPQDGTTVPVFLDDVGFFYLIRLEPNHDPGRFKVGFTTELDGRLQKHRCSAPFAEYMKTWPCRRVWERAAIDCATDGCEKLHTEVFRTTALDKVATRADTFFSVMPSLLAEVDDDSEGPEAGPDDPALNLAGLPAG
jgi:hypothetical protein